MKKILLPFLLFFALTSVYGQSGICDTAYWNHTYANERLKIYDSCYTITATIIVLDPPLLTGDGDYHIYTKPDSQYTWMIYYRDSVYLRSCEGSGAADTIPGALNVEEICKGTIEDTGPDGVVENAACLNFNDTVYLPAANEHVQITGPFVYDTVHCWNELHPVSRMVVLPPLGISQPDWTSLANNLKVFPSPANHEIEFAFDRAPGAVTLIKIYTITGQQLFIYGMAQTSSLKLDVSTWPVGQYLYTIVAQEQNKVLRSDKFTVVH
jgi:hypothetical protein